jgi:HTH-type transcriptional regulator, transcriptional repressor of NAD biosynthesis genes
MSVKRGLTLGKYAPFHRGHQLVIETALAEMDEVIVIIYDAPETTSVPLSVRAGWIRRLYPTVQVIEAWDGPTEVGDSEAIKRKHEDYVLNSLKINGITHFYSSEFYGEHMSQALGAINRLVDCDRRMVPVSGSDVRRSPYTLREFVDAFVYRDLVTTVVFVGAPSTGKTTMASQLAEQFNTVWMPEYGREYWETHQVNRRLTLKQLEEIAEGHLERENKRLLNANGYLFVDTNAITTYMFSLSYHGTATPRLTELAVRAACRYDLVFLCDVDIPYDDTWDRSGDTNRLSFQKQIVSDLTVRKLPYFVLRGDIEARVKRVEAILGKYKKYMNLPDLCPW